MTETQKLILNKLEELCRLCSHQRLGQIIFNYICFGKLYGDNLFSMSDEEMLKILEKNIKEIETANQEIETIRKKIEEK